jgi:NTP pyrophosphatase (non-canonical NTP hydrolase)
MMKVLPSIETKAKYDLLKKVEKISLVITELGEAIEALREGKSADLELVEGFTVSNDKDYVITNLDRFVSTFEFYVKDSVEDELADATIRILEFCYAIDVDLFNHINLKSLYNTTRKNLHGKKF